MKVQKGDIVTLMPAKVAFVEGFNVAITWPASTPGMLNCATVSAFDIASVEPRNFAVGDFAEHQGQAGVIRGLCGAYAWFEPTGSKLVTVFRDVLTRVERP